MRLLTQFCLAIAGALLACGASQTAAQTIDTSRGLQALNAILPPVVGQRACFARTYDRQHLAEHPRQRVTAMMFRLQYAKIPDTDIQHYEFWISVKVRTRWEAFHESGVCDANVDATYPAGNLCWVACDAGGVSIEKVPQSDALHVHVETPSEGIVLNASCGERQRKALRLQAGEDDKLFRLESVPLSQCEAAQRATRPRRGSR
jgi:hypothetical protein